MKLTADQLEEARAIPHPAVKALVEFYEFVVGNSLVYETYVARVLTLEKWNSDLIKHKVSLISPKDGDEKEQQKTEKEVDRVLKVLEKQDQLVAGTEAIRAKLSPQQQEQLLLDKRLKASKDLAF